MFASPVWVAFDRGGTCAAVARSELLASPGHDQARATLSFDRPPGRRRGQLHLRLSRPALSGSTVLVAAGGATFQLATRGADAWSTGPAQEAALIAAIRAAGDLRARFRSSDGGHTDRYLLAGAPTAIDAAAAGCAAPR
ncbi:MULTISPECIES: hypothetical protein [Sphingomonas]|uniref:hypothetical protein n=1 Tax=Sphingomonas TaxID=13687 RepID=UPI000DEF33E9|nr:MULTISPECIES: hypothetical protein [Sphingomonas]